LRKGNSYLFIKIGVQKTLSFGSGMNGQGLNSSVLKKPWGCSRAEGSPADEGKGVMHPLTSEAPDFSRGAARQSVAEISARIESKKQKAIFSFLKIVFNLINFSIQLLQGLNAEPKRDDKKGRDKNQRENWFLKCSGHLG
jgi:hypothetical protein